MIVLLTALPAHAELMEPDWAISSPVESQSGPTATDISKPAKPVLNITQPKVEQLAPTRIVAPVKTRKTKVTIKPTKAAVRRKKSSTRKSVSRARKNKRKRTGSSHKTWWRKTGNPVVFKFRDCLSEHARQYGRSAGPVSPRYHILQAMDLSCRAEFDKMARTIAAKFGTDGFRKLSDELIQTTFLPAVTRHQ